MRSGRAPTFKPQSPRKVPKWGLGSSAELGPSASRPVLNPAKAFRDRKGTPKNFWDKDFAELSGELSGVICLKPLFYWVVPSNRSEDSLVLFVRFIWLWGSSLAPGIWPPNLGENYS